MGLRRAVLVVVLLLVCAPSAAADESLQSTGSLVYSWHGDPARGCAQAGLCSARGALVIQPEGGADVSGVQGSNGQLSFNGQTATVRVQGGTPGSSGLCVDQPGASGGGPGFFELHWNRSGAVTATFGPPVSSGRCAGPLAAEITRVPINGHRSPGRHPSFDFRRSTGFVAGPFSGTLVSTLVLSPGGFGGGFSSTSSGSSTGPAPAGRMRLEQVHLRYGVAVAAGSLQVGFRGEDGPFCAALDACGTSGSLMISWPAREQRLDIFANRVVRSAVSRRRALADFRAGRLNLEGGPPLGEASIRLAETFAGAGGQTCTDSVPVKLALGFGLFGPGPGSTLPVTLSNFSDGDVLRTHCPGPGFADVFGPSQNLASGALTRRQLLQRASSAPLSTTGRFGAPGYVGARSGVLRLSLKLLKVVAGTL